MLKTILQAAILSSLVQPKGDAIPDFSRVGYHCGDREIPEIEVLKVLEAPSDSMDCREIIQKALDEVPSPGAVLLKAGTYYVDGSLNITRSGVVLRGEGKATRIVATKRSQHTLINVGMQEKRTLEGEPVIITSRYTPVGQMYVVVDRPKRFHPGDAVVIFRPGTEEWIHDIRMDRIPQTSKTNTVRQWRTKEYDLYWERTVTAVKGRKVYLDNPVVMALDIDYGGGWLVQCSMERISEVGVENLVLDSEYDATVLDKNGRFVDEQHAWTAVSYTNCENCWARGIDSWHFGYGLVSLNYGCRKVTVTDCHSHLPVSIVTGGRRYALGLKAGAELNLIKDCSCDSDRHGCVTGARVCGPNVFLRCKGTNMLNDFGPHHRWSTGVLYDCVSTDKSLNLQDRGSWGSGHGWAGANFVLWNCEPATITCQCPWTSAYNWAVGCYGTVSSYSKAGVVFKNSTRSHADKLQRPDGIWYSHGKHVDPESLYEYQLKARHDAGIYLDN